jgi:hypothetical protein
MTATLRTSGALRPATGSTWDLVEFRPSLHVDQQPRPGSMPIEPGSAPFRSTAVRTSVRTSIASGASRSPTSGHRERNSAARGRIVQPLREVEGLVGCKSRGGSSPLRRTREAPQTAGFLRAGCFRVGFGRTAQRTRPRKRGTRCARRCPDRSSARMHFDRWCSSSARSGTARSRPPRSTADSWRSTLCPRRGPRRRCARPNVWCPPRRSGCIPRLAPTVQPSATCPRPPGDRRRRPCRAGVRGYARVAMEPPSEARSEPVSPSGPPGSAASSSRAAHGERHRAVDGFRDRDLALLRAHEPLLRYTKGELFLPTAVERYVARCSLWAGQEDGRATCAVPFGGLDLPRLCREGVAHQGRPLSLRFVQAPLARAAYRRWKRAPRERLQAAGRFTTTGMLGRLLDAVFRGSLLLRGTVGRGLAAAAEVAYRGERDAARFVYYGRVVRAGGTYACSTGSSTP